MLHFNSPPARGDSGQVRVYDAASKQLIDTIDLAIPAGPTGRGRGAADASEYQRTVIGGFTEGFHFQPLIVRGNDATITLHHGVLSYGRTYYVQIDRGVLSGDGFDGVAGTTGWTFTTKLQPPALTATHLVVSADGRGDFNTVQGAIDFIPDRPSRRVTVFIRSGLYEEIVYFRNKHDITFLGEHRQRVVIGYANNEIFNGPPAGVATNEKPDTFPYRRAAFMADRSTDIEIDNLTLRNFTPQGGGQAEALLLSGGRNQVRRVSLYSHQDTLQFNDSVYMEDSYVEGDTDFLWGRGPAFFYRCTFRQLSATSPFMWVRSTQASHGFVFVRSRFETAEAAGPGPYLARNTAAYPYSEVVLLHSALGAIHPAAWSLAGDTSHEHYWEFDSVSIKDGSPADVSQRDPASRQLTMAQDAATIANYSQPAFVLGGWTPVRRR